MKRFTLFDAAIAGFVLVLLPVAYGTYLLFRAPRPTMASVHRVEITKEERRIGGPGLVAKMKIQGSGFRPLLRATVDDLPAIGFVFESPNSADLLLGAVPPGAHDLVLYDGVQEVARLRNGVTIDPPASRAAMVRVRLESPTEVTRLVAVGDRDWSPNPNGAVVTAIDGDALVVRLGATLLGEGWQYFDEALKPGVPFTLTTKRYVVKGVVLSVTVENTP
jgi:hypothetical protein